MNQQLTENEIMKLLEYLNFPSQADIMQQKLFFMQTETIRQLRINDERIIEALMTIALNNSSASIREEANKTLKYLGKTPPPTKDHSWIRWGRAGITFGVLSSLIDSVIFTTIFNDRNSTAGAEAAYVNCILIWLIGIFGGFCFGVIGGYFAKIVDRRINSQLNLPLIFAYTAGVFPGVIYLVLLIHNL